MLVTSVEAAPLRSLNQFRVDLEPGVVSLVGPNGTGKTNLLEALYFALTGRSFRTSDRRELIPFGCPLARAEAVVREEDGVLRTLLASVSRSEGRRHLLDGNPADAATIAHHRPLVAVFSPDRLSLIKGPPAERRAHLDGFAAARWPSRSGLRRRYGQALAQRNALLSRVAAGRADIAELDVWDAALAEAGEALGIARAETVSALKAPFTAAAEELGLAPGAAISYAPRAPSTATEIRVGLSERLDADLKLGRSSWGPHLDELKLDAAGGRSFRRFGSQGEQRAALLALIFAEREALMLAGRPPPLLLLDDVMSELDPERRRRLVERLQRGGQALITAAAADSLPAQVGAALVTMPGADSENGFAEAA